jgi:hypothetical protein
MDSVHGVARIQELHWAAKEMIRWDVQTSE